MKSPSAFVLWSAVVLAVVFLGFLILCGLELWDDRHFIWEPRNPLAKYGVSYEKTWGEHEEYQTIQFTWIRDGKKFDGPSVTGDDLYVRFPPVNGADVPEIVVRSDTYKDQFVIFKLNFTDSTKPEFELVQCYMLDVQYTVPWFYYYADSDTGLLPTRAKPPALGDQLPDNGLEFLMDKGRRIDVLTDSGQTYPGYRIFGDDVYQVAVNGKGTIIYISPDDPAIFKTPEGIKVGATLNKVLAIAKTPPRERMGWAYYIPLSSGWNAAFVVNPQNPTSGKLPEDSHVSFLFKSDWAR